MRFRTVLVSSVFAPLALVMVACAGDDSEDLPDAARRDAAGLLDSGDPFTDDAETDAGPVDAGQDSGPVDAGPPDSGFACDDPKDFGGADSLQQLAAITDDKTIHFVSQDSKAGTVLAGANDADSYIVYSDDVFQFDINPKPFAEAETGVADAQLCIFIKCADLKGLKSAPTCGSGVATANPLTGDPGCCAATPNKVHIDYNCNSGDDDINMTMRLKATKQVCLPYDIKYLAGD
jgi:hypothetical protein